MRRGVSGPTRKLLCQWEKLHLENGLLYRRNQRSQFVLPDRYRYLVLRHLHDNMGHMGAERFLGLARDRFYWPYMKQDVEAYVTRKCPCIKQKKPVSHIRAPMGSVTSTSEINPERQLQRNYLKTSIHASGTLGNCIMTMKENLKTNSSRA